VPIGVLKWKKDTEPSKELCCNCKEAKNRLRVNKTQEIYDERVKKYIEGKNE